jgi:hypothetical protein
MTTTERIACAYHEASHTVLHAVHYRDQIRSVSLAADGVCGLTSALSRRSTYNSVKSAICCLAGPAAEYLVTEKLARANGGIDLDHAENHLRRTGLCLDDVWPKTLSLVCHYEDEIHTVAAALLSRGKHFRTRCR